MRRLDSVIERFEEGEVNTCLVFELEPGEPALQPAGILIEERERSSEQPIGEAKEHRGLLPG